MATFDEYINSIIADGNDGKAFERFCKHFLFLLLFNKYLY